MKHPLTLRFKILALAPQIFVEDAEGQTVCYVKQKLLRFREKVEVFQDTARQQPLAEIEADRIIDWSARYHFTLTDGQVLGSVGRRGLRSLWQAHYEVETTRGARFTIREANPFAKMADSIFGSIPLLGLASCYLFHPAYVATDAQGAEVMRLTKQPAFWEGRFSLTKAAALPPEEELALLFSFMMLALLERERG